MSRIGAVLLFCLTACGAPPTDLIPDERPVDRCPDPGAGIEIGGFTGTGADTPRRPLRRIVLMGGGREEDAAARWFVEAALTGDIVVLRVSGSLTSYPDYFIGHLASVTPATVITIRTSSPEAGADPAVLCRVARAEAVWLAGGNQWDYLGRWPTALHEALAAVAERDGAMGGISAGAVSLGEAAFDAQFGTIASGDALANPLRREVSLSRPVFAQPELDGVLVDSHFTERKREGRLLVFLARFLAERGEDPVVGLGLDEGVALMIEAGSYEVTSRGAGAAWMYEVAGPSLLLPGVPLSLDGIRRVRLPAGSVGPWPFSFDASGDVRVMHVADGVVIAGPRG
ncbi:MAG: hypothetical protein OXN18_16635 [Gemmatimonadota bacterium]|nr:hypothetical protein [Gemmatimonadota bacterium]